MTETAPESAGERQSPPSLMESEWWLRVEPAPLLLARLVVGVIFLVAGVTKVTAPGQFAEAVRAYHLMPVSLSYPFALALPWLEILAALYLLVGFMTRIASAACLLMLAMFEFALMQSLVTGHTHHSCGCFGSGAVNPVLAFLEGGNVITSWDVIRDLILVALAALIFFFGAGPFSIENRMQPEEDF
jgi:uncharacterized membrane protein YphA (DoxX/SURF4 family)